MKVFITGATGGFGMLLLKRLADDPDIDEIIGLSNEDIDEEIDDVMEEDENFKYFVGDTRKKRVEEVFQKNPDIDVLVHLAYDNSPEHSQQEVEETNVFGTLRMIRLARKYGIKKFIFKSPTIVYGANPDNPAVVTEDSPLRGNRNSPSIRNKIEADMTCQMNMHPGLLPKIVILRCAAIVGDDVRAPLNTLLKSKVFPMVAGFDPMFQVMHQDDVARALEICVKHHDAEGTFNVAGMRTEPLSEVVNRFDRVAVPMPELVLKTIYKYYFMSKRQHSFPFDLDFLKYPFVADTTRAKEILGFTPEVL